MNTLVWRTPHHCIHRPQRKCIFDIFHHLDLSPSTSKQQSIGNARDLRQGGSFICFVWCVRCPLPAYFYACFFTWISIINPCKAAIGQFLTLPNRCQESTVRFTVSISQSLHASMNSACKKRKPTIVVVSGSFEGFSYCSRTEMWKEWPKRENWLIPCKIRNYPSLTSF